MFFQHLDLSPCRSVQFASSFFMFFFCVCTCFISPLAVWPLQTDLFLAPVCVGPQNFNCFQTCDPKQRKLTIAQSSTVQWNCSQTIMLTMWHGCVIWTTKFHTKEKRKKNKKNWQIKTGMSYSSCNGHYSKTKSPIKTQRWRLLHKTNLTMHKLKTVNPGRRSMYNQWKWFELEWLNSWET